MLLLIKPHCQERAQSMPARSPDQLILPPTSPLWRESDYQTPATPRPSHIFANLLLFGSASSLVTNSYGLFFLPPWCRLGGYSSLAMKTLFLVNGCVILLIFCAVVGQPPLFGPQSQLRRSIHALSGSSVPRGVVSMTSIIASGVRVQTLREGVF